MIQYLRFPSASDPIRIVLFFACTKATIILRCIWIFWCGQILLNLFSYGDGRLSCVPVLPYSTFDMVSDPGRISPARSTSKRWLDMAPTTSTVKASYDKHHFGAQYIPSIVTVYASCRYLYRLRKTRFRWLTRPCRTGLATCREVLRCFIF